MAQHHFLMVAFDLMGIPSLYELGKMSKDLYSLSFELRIKNMPKIDEIRYISVIFHDVPTIELIAAIFFSDGLEEPSAFDFFLSNYLERLFIN